MRLALGLVALARPSPLAERDRCYPDQRYSYGLCYTIDATVSPVDGNEANASCAHFGDVCAGEGDCACLTDTSRCPDGWSCLDLSVYLPGLPAIFLKPS
jgi:hypothetical protein